VAADERDAFLALARRAGAHGVYVGNDIFADGRPATLAARGLGLHGRTPCVGLAWFGARGNLVLLADDPPLPPDAVADAVVRSGREWRIALGPEPVLAEIRKRLREPPILVRRQIYYVADPEAVYAVEPDARVRPAAEPDLEALVAASLELNRSDLHLDPARVSRRWLRHALRERMRNATAWVLGPPGAPVAKLDVGSEGPLGAVIEGVFTVPEQRGRGHARALVHAAVRRQLEAGRPLVCLHVADANHPARSCYANAGMRPAVAVGLLLRDG